MKYLLIICLFLSSCSFKITKLPEEVALEKEKIELQKQQLEITKQQFELNKKEAFFNCLNIITDKLLKKDESAVLNIGLCREIDPQLSEKIKKTAEIITNTPELKNKLEKIFKQP